MHTEQPTAVQFYLKCGQEDCFPCGSSEAEWEGGVCRTTGETNGGDEDPDSPNGSSALTPPSLPPPPPPPPPLLNTLLFLTPSLCSGWTEGSGENSKTGRIKEHLSSHLQPVCYRTTKSISRYGLSDYLVLTGGEDNWKEGQK